MTRHEFEARCGAVVDGLARHFAHESDDAMTPALERLRKNLIAQYAAAFPDARPGDIADLVDDIIGGIRSRRAEIAARDSHPFVNREELMLGDWVEVTAEIDVDGRFVEHSPRIIPESEVARRALLDSEIDSLAARA
jgi:hypothetical protein